jgi:hypothetical protein
MTSKLCIATAALAVWIAPSIANADTKVTAKAGGWSAFGGTTANKNRPVCGMSTSPKDKYFGLKHFSGDDTFTIQIGAKEWTITNRSKYAVVMQFDGNPVWNANGTGMHFNDGDPGLEYTVRKSELAKFIKEFGNSKRLQIQFKQGGMASWVLDLTGVKSVRDSFEACNLGLK